MRDRRRGGRVGAGLVVLAALLVLGTPLAILAYCTVIEFEALVTRLHAEGFLQLNVLRSHEGISWKPVSWDRGTWRRRFSLMGASDARRDGSSLGVVLTHLPARGLLTAPRRGIDLPEQPAGGDGPSFTVLVRHVRGGQPGQALTPARLVEAGWLRPQLARALEKHSASGGYRFESGGVTIQYRATDDTAILRVFGDDVL